jgi:two-component system LytT family response regulator
MRILLIEDELAQLKKLKMFFEESFPDYHVEMAMTFDDARIKILESNFDIGIFDIYLKGRSIFELLDGVNFSKREIVFLTGNNEFAMKAFECYAVDYIVKPYDTNRLLNSIKIASDRLLHLENRIGENRIESLSKAVIESKIEFIALPNMTGVKLVPIDQIVAVEAARSYSTFHLVNKDTITISKSLNWAENNLQPLGFFRVHRSWLVSRDHITDFIKQNGYSLKMTTGLLIGITDKAKSRVFEWIKSFTISD